MKNHKKLWFTIETLCIALFPIVLGMALTSQEFKSTSRTLINFALVHLGISIDFSSFITAIIWIWFVVWITVSVISQFRKRSDHESTKQLVIGARDKSVFRNSRVFINNVEPILAELHSIHDDISTFDIGACSALNSLILEEIQLLAASFFGLKQTAIGVNVMLYIPKTSESNSIIKNLLADDCLYVRPNRYQSLLGALYLHTNLRLDIPGATCLKRLSIPIYDRSSKAYFMGMTGNYLNAVIPGAPLALFEENSYIADTTSKLSYLNLDQYTVDEAIDFFTEHESKTRSIVSFRIPLCSSSHNNGRIHGEGVLNLETSSSFYLQNRHSYYDTFYALLYPTLRGLSNSLVCYREHTLELLT